MPIARDEAGNLWEVDAQGNPVRHLPAQGASRGTIITAPKTPDQIEDRDFKRRDQALQEEAARLARLRAELDIREANTKKATADARGGVDSASCAFLKAIMTFMA